MGSRPPAGRRSGMTETASVLVLLVHFRTPTEAVRCLHSLARERVTVPGLQAVLWDNASGKELLAPIEAARSAEGWQEWLSIEVSERNLGFGAGNNAVLRPRLEAGTLPERVLLLNPDTEVQPGAIAELLRFEEQHEHADFVGPATASRPPAIDGTAFRFPGLISQLVDGIRFGFVARLLARWMVPMPPSEEAMRADWVSGGAVLVRRRVFEQIGLFDEAFFLYFEETDLSYRAAKRGFQSWYNPKSLIYHFAGASTGLGRPEGPPPRFPAYWFASRQHYYRKRYGRILTWLVDLGFVLGRAVWTLLASLLGRRRADPPAYLRDFALWNLLGRRWQGVRGSGSE